MTQSQTQSFGFTPSSTQSPEEQKAAFLQAQEQAWQQKYEQEQKKAEFVAGAKVLAEKYHFIQDAKVPSAVRNKMLEQAGFEAEEDLGVSIAKTATMVAVTTFAVTATAIIIYAGVKWLFFSDGTVAAAVMEPSAELGS